MLEDWKKVIWTDESAVVLGRRATRVGRTAERNTALYISYTQSSWNNYSELMVRPGFLYDHKDHLDVWEKKTTKVNKEAEADLEQCKAAREPR